MPKPKSYTNTTTTKRRASFLPPEASQVLKSWFMQHIQCPYPTRQDKEYFKQTLGLTPVQIQNFFKNARKRCHTKFNSRPLKTASIKKKRYTRNGAARAQSRVPKKTKKTPLKILNSYESNVESPTNESNIVGSELTAIVIRAIPSLSTRSQNKSLNERSIEEQLEIIELAKSTPARRRKKRSVKLLCKEEPIPSISNHFEQMPHQNVYQDIRDSTSKLCSNNSLNEIENQLSIITYSQLPIITQDFSTEPIASEFTLLDDTAINTKLAFTMKIYYLQKYHFKMIHYWIKYLQRFNVSKNRKL